MVVIVCCVFLPTIIIIISHLGILFKIRRAGKMFSNKAAGKQSSKAESQFIRVSIIFSRFYLKLKVNQLAHYYYFYRTIYIPLRD